MRGTVKGVTSCSSRPMTTARALRRRARRGSLVVILLSLAAASTGAPDAALTCAGTLYGFSDDSTTHGPRVRLPHGGRLLVLYQYHEAPKAAENLRFFLDVTVFGPAQRRAETQGMGGAVDGDGSDAVSSADVLAEGVDHVYIMYVFIYICMNVCMRMYVCMYELRLYLCTYVCFYVCTHKHTHTHTHTQTHTHTHT
jgi:hypothetical protein